ncbi:MAG TPA: purine-nucleoside phosphorylase [Tenericutes bacterium]|nr:purine-nucleoside phosphorylase [Mycoplasmatota bacterium]
MTPHIEAKKEDIAKTVLMPGDPKRAKFIAENFLENYKLVNSVRGMTAYTGEYKGKKITIFPSGMGNPSMGIYSYELFKFYDVENIIRIGSCGAYTKDLNLYDVVLVSSSYSDSSYAKAQNNRESSEISPSAELNNKIKERAGELGIPVTEGTIHCSDVFYRENSEAYKKFNEDHNCIGVEMESFALFHNAEVLGKKAACLLTVSDSLVTKEKTTSEEREKRFTEMIEIALGLI